MPATTSWRRIWRSAIRLWIMPTGTKRTSASPAMTATLAAAARFMERHVAARIWQRYGESEDKPMKKAKKARKVKPIPAEYHTVTPYLACGNGDAAIEFYSQAFGGKVAHAEVETGASRIILTGESAAMNFLIPAPRGGTTVHIHLYVKHCDALTDRAVKACYGDRMGTVQDPFGHVCHLATHIEDLSMAEMRKRGEKRYHA